MKETITIGDYLEATGQQLEPKKLEFHDLVCDMCEDLQPREVCLKCRTAKVE